MTNKTKENLSRAAVATVGIGTFIVALKEIDNPDRKVAAYIGTGAAGIVTAWALGLLEDIF